MTSKLIEQVPDKKQLNALFNMTYKVEIDLGSDEKTAKRIAEKVVRAIIETSLIEEEEEEELLTP